MGVEVGGVGDRGEGRYHPTIAKPDATTARAKARYVVKREGTRGGRCQAGAPTAAFANPAGADGYPLEKRPSEGPFGGISDIGSMLSLFNDSGIQLLPSGLLLVRV
jgi:hypothetical protein